MGNSDSKSKFRESVYKLNNEVISSKNLEFWDKLWRIPTLAEEIFTLIQPDDVRMLRRQQPSNLATMFRQAVSQLIQIVDTPVPKYYSQATNCIRVLTRLVPFILEDTSDTFVEELFWKIEEEGEQPLAVQLIHAIMGLLFLPEFTVSIHAYKGYGEERRTRRVSGSGSSSSSGSNSNPAVYPSLLWHAGVSYPDTHVQHSVTYDKNRKEVLKLLLTCFSSILYQTPEQCSSYTDRMVAIATSRDCPFAWTLFYSLLNIIVNYDPVGWGVPYAGSIVVDDREALVDISIQVLLVVLDSDSESNQYRHLLSSIHRIDDFALLFNGLSRLLNNYHMSMNTLLPHSIKQIKCHQELLVLLWKLLDENKSFLSYVLKQADVNQFVIPLLYLMVEGRQEANKVGMIHICTFILLLLSGERDFGVNLNKSFEQRITFMDLPSFVGATHADVVIVCLHKIIVSGVEKLNSVYNCFLTIICNISPYIKKLHMMSAVRLLRLFKLFSTPRYLFENEANHHLIFFLLETFDNIIQYQYEGNVSVIYCILQNKHVFYQLSELKLINSSFTEEWLMNWKKKLPLTTSLRLLQYLLPQLEALDHPMDEESILSFLRSTTMVGLLPVPHPIVIRKYQINQFTHLWFTTFTWGVIFLRNQVLPLFDGHTITLFTINVL